MATLPILPGTPTTYKNDSTGFNIGVSASGAPLDYTSTLQTAINNLPNTTGDRLEIPPGIYYLKTGVTWTRKPGILAGSGMDSTIFVCDSDFLTINNSPIELNPTSPVIYGNVIIQDMTIISTKPCTATAINCIGSFLSPEAKQTFIIERCSFLGSDYRLQPVPKVQGISPPIFRTKNGWSTSIQLAASNCTIRNCSIIGPRGARSKIGTGMRYGVLIKVGTDIKIVDNFIADCQEAVRYLPANANTQTEAIVISNTQMIDVDYGVRIPVSNDRSNYHTIKNCYIGSLVCGVSISGETSTTAVANYCFIDGNMLLTYGGTGISDYLSNQCSATWVGVAVSGTHNVVCNNIIIGQYNKRQEMCGVDVGTVNSTVQSAYNIIVNNNIFACDKGIRYGKMAGSDTVYGNRLGSTSNPDLGIQQALTIEPYDGAKANEVTTLLPAKGSSCSIKYDTVAKRIVIGTLRTNIELPTVKITPRPLEIKPYHPNTGSNDPTIILTGNLQLNHKRISTTLPIKGNSAGFPGELVILTDTSIIPNKTYLYYCVATNTWKRTELVSF